MAKDAYSLAQESLQKSQELARISSDNYLGLSQAESELSSRLSFMKVQIQKNHEAAQKSSGELRAELEKTNSTADALYSAGTEKLQELDRELMKLKECTSSLEEEMGKRPQAKGKEQATLEAMKLSLSIMKTLLRCQAAYMKLLERLGVLRSYVETLEDLTSGEINWKEAQRLLPKEKRRIAS